MRTLLFFISLLSFTGCSGKSNEVKSSYANPEVIQTDTFRITLSDTTYFDCIPDTTPGNPENCGLIFKDIGQTGYFIVTYNPNFNGKVFEGNFNDGKQEGIWLEYGFKPEVVKSRENYLNNKAHGEWIVYTDDGTQIERKEYYQNGKKEGAWIYYNNNGKPALKEIYKDDILISEETL